MSFWEKKIVISSAPVSGINNDQSLKYDNQKHTLLRFVNFFGSKFNVSGQRSLPTLT